MQSLLTNLVFADSLVLSIGITTGRIRGHRYSHDGNTTFEVHFYGGIGLGAGLQGAKSNLVFVAPPKPTPGRPGEKTFDMFQFRNKVCTLQLYATIALL